MSVHACTARDQVDKRKRQEKKLCALAPVDTIGSLGRMAYLKWGGSDLGKHTRPSQISIDINRQCCMTRSFLLSSLSVCLYQVEYWSGGTGPRTKTQSKRDWPNKSNTQSHSPSPFREKSGTMTLYSRKFSWRFIINETRGERKERKKERKKVKKGNIICWLSGGAARVWFAMGETSDTETLPSRRYFLGKK
jgi:hypothetical protein